MLIYVAINDRDHFAYSLRRGAVGMISYEFGPVLESIDVRSVDDRGLPHLFSESMMALLPTIIPAGVFIDRA